MSIKRLTAKKINSSQMRNDSEPSENENLNNSVRIQKMQSNPEYPMVINSDTEFVGDTFEGQNNNYIGGLNSGSQSEQDLNNRKELTDYDQSYNNMSGLP